MYLEGDYQFLNYTFIFSLLYMVSFQLLGKCWTKFDKLDKAVQIEFASRIVSAVHAGVVCLRGAHVFFTDENIFNNKLMYTSETLSLTYHIALGYFIYDFFLILYYYNEIFDFVFMIHHIVSVTGCYISLKYGYFALLLVVRCLSELSTVFVNTGWMLLNLKMTNSKLYYLNGLFLFVSFCLVRIYPIVPHWNIYFYEYSTMDLWNNIPTLWKAIFGGFSGALDVLNVYWFYRIGSMIHQAVYGSKKID